jgi:hypothetical protein
MPPALQDCPSTRTTSTGYRIDAFLTALSGQSGGYAGGPDIGTLGSPRLVTGQSVLPFSDPGRNTLDGASGSPGAPSSGRGIHRAGACRGSPASSSGVGDAVKEPRRLCSGCVLAIFSSGRWEPARPARTPRRRGRCVAITSACVSVSCAGRDRSCGWRVVCSPGESAVPEHVRALAVQAGPRSSRCTSRSNDGRRRDMEWAARRPSAARPLTPHRLHR